MTTTFTPKDPVWCSGCGHYGVRGALVNALSELDIPAHETFLLAGIGCSGSIQNNVNAYGYHSMHGRVLPTAIGAAIANPDLTVIAAGGDGDGYAIGMGHFAHAIHRNASVLYILMNNAAYGLTKGQDSPTSELAQVAGHSPALDGMSMGLSIPGATFLARGFTRWSDQLNGLLIQGLEHVRAKKGFAFLEVLSPCVTYNDTYPDWDAQMYNVDEDPDFSCTDRGIAFQTIERLRSEGRIASGLIHQGEQSAFEANWIKEGLCPANLEAHEPQKNLDTLHDIMTSYST
ncbi:MAG: 2-oxoacid:ferredoxin oxidoreductase subunit beta [Rhodospirillaceae bacterium]|nr:2-oxoacid:ferredoxin oxidoreductase subunit beta [Rhodospirillaceae bacterium]MBL6932304.1 2-oxoacid:ferredoxin oxidoreductase subunit beta [Rhodospirillales bacterium]